LSLGLSFPFGFNFLLVLIKTVSFQNTKPHITTCSKVAKKAFGFALLLHFFVAGALAKTELSA